MFQLVFELQELECDQCSCSLETVTRTVVVHFKWNDLMVLVMVIMFTDYFNVYYNHFIPEKSAEVRRKENEVYWRTERLLYDLQLAHNSYKRMAVTCSSAFISLLCCGPCQILLVQLIPPIATHFLVVWSVCHLLFVCLCVTFVHLS